MFVVRNAGLASKLRFRVQSKKNRKKIFKKAFYRSNSVLFRKTVKFFQKKFFIKLQVVKCT